MHLGCGIEKLYRLLERLKHVGKGGTIVVYKSILCENFDQILFSLKLLKSNTNQTDVQIRKNYFTKEKII